MDKMMDSYIQARVQIKQSQQDRMSIPRAENV